MGTTPIKKTQNKHTKRDPHSRRGRKGKRKTSSESFKGRNYYREAGREREGKGKTKTREIERERETGQE